MQLVDQKLSYFSSFWNKLDFMDLLLTLFIVLMTMPKQSDIINFVRILAAFSSCLKMTKLFDWLRLFDSTSFYIHLISETLSDIQAFMILFFTALGMFGMPMLMLNLNNDPADSMIDDTLGFWLPNMMMNQYLLSLGEFNMEPFADNPTTILCYIFFICATFMTQLTMLNMLIAIMGDTFSRVIEDKEVNATKTKLELMADLKAIMKGSGARDDDEVFLFVAMPEDVEDEGGDSWEGAFSKMARYTSNLVVNMEATVNKQLGKTHELIETMDKREAITDKNLSKMLTSNFSKTLKNADQAKKVLDETVTGLKRQADIIERSHNETK